ncbi:MAG: iron ABC transporter permease [Gemmatimonadetes bacterium]|nr:iron ABC transporter permease [Gemmatimonadota bacterium]
MSGETAAPTDAPTGAVRAVRPSAWRWARRRALGGRTGLAAALLTVLLAWVVVYPLLIVGAEGARADLGLFVRQRTEWSALWASLWISAASVVLAAAIGVPLAFVFERYDFPGRRFLGSLVALPAVMPPLVGVIAFLFLYGESGFVAHAVRAVTGAESPWRLQGAGAILLVHAYSMYVYFYLFTRAGLAKLDASMLEAAASLGAGGWTTFRRVTIPLLRPALAGAALLTFMTALASFSAPYVFGGGFRVMTTQIVATKLNGDLPMAMLETAALTALALAGFAVIQRTEGSRLVTSVGKGTPPALRVIAHPAARRLAALAGWLLAIVLLLPHATLVLVSLVPLNTWTTEALPPKLSLENWAAVFSEAEKLRPLVNSLWMATVATAASLGVAVWAGQLVVRRRVALGRAIETLLALPWAVPGTVLAIGLATLFSLKSPWTGRWVLVGTLAILPLAYFVRNLPLTGRAVLAGFRQLDPALDEAAQSLGAGRWRRLIHVTLPLLKPALAAGGALAFVTALGDFVTSILLYTYETRPISWEILESLRLNNIGVAAAFGVVLMVVSAAALGVGARAGR